MKPSPYWSEEEIEILKRLWLNPEVIYEDLEQVFPDRSRRGIRHKANQLKLPPYSMIRKAAINRDFLKSLLEVVEG